MHLDPLRKGRSAGRLGTAPCPDIRDFNAGERSVQAIGVWTQRRDARALYVVPGRQGTVGPRIPTLRLAPGRLVNVLRVPCVPAHSPVPRRPKASAAALHRNVEASGRCAPRKKRWQLGASQHLASGQVSGEENLACKRLHAHR